MSWAYMGIHSLEVCISPPAQPQAKIFCLVINKTNIPIKKKQRHWLQSVSPSEAHMLAWDTCSKSKISASTVLLTTWWGRTLPKHTWENPVLTLPVDPMRGRKPAITNGRRRRLIAGRRQKAILQIHWGVTLVSTSLSTWGNCATLGHMLRNATLGRKPLPIDHPSLKSSNPS
jgi:hypothetical protein